MRCLQKYQSAQCGASIIEYTLLLVLVAGVVILGLQALGRSTGTPLCQSAIQQQEGGNFDQVNQVRYDADRECCVLDTGGGGGAPPCL